MGDDTEVKPQRRKTVLPRMYRLRLSKSSSDYWQELVQRMGCEDRELIFRPIFFAQKRGIARSDCYSVAAGTQKWRTRSFRVRQIVFSCR